MPSNFKEFWILALHMHSCMHVCGGGSGDGGGRAAISNKCRFSLGCKLDVTIVPVKVHMTQHNADLIQFTGQMLYDAWLHHDNAQDKCGAAISSHIQPQ